MPDNLYSPHVIQIVGGTSMTQGSTITVENITKINSNDPEKNKLRDELDTNKKRSVDLANMRAGYDNGDLIVIKVSGVRSATSYYTVDTTKGSKVLNMTQSAADVAFPSITL